MQMTVVSANSIISRIYQGISLAKALQEFSTNPREFFQWLAADPALYNEYNMAQQSRAEIMVEEIVDIADTENDSSRARNRIDSRKFYAGVMKPQKFGQRVDINLNHTVDINGALSDARGRVLNLPGNQHAQVIDAQAITDQGSTDHKSVAPPQMQENEEIDPFS